MSKRTLPNDDGILRLLLKTATDFLDFTEPALRQLQHEKRIIEKAVLDKRVDPQFFREVHQALHTRLAQGGPSYAAILPYIDAGAARNSLEVLAEEKAKLEHRMRVSGRSEKEERVYLLICIWHLVEVVGTASDAVARVQHLQREIIDKLSCLQSSGDLAFMPDMSSAVSSEGVDGVSELDDAAEDTGITSTTKELPDRAKAKGKMSKSTAMVSNVNHLMDFALGIDEHRHWQVFRKHRNEWYSKGRLELPKDGRESTLLKTIAAEGGSATRLALMKAIQASFSDWEGVDIYTGIVKSTLSRLRTKLRIALNLSMSVDPIPWEGELKGYCLLLKIGHAEKDEQDRIKFRPGRAT